jgi:hypothetical protein
MFWKATISVQGDVGTFIRDLAGLAAKKTTFPESWLSTLQERDRVKEAKNEAKGDDKTEFINPVRLHQLLEEKLDDNSILVADGGDFVGTAAYILRPRGPLCWLDPGAFGTLGVGGGFALGAKLCRPDAEVWVIYGDGTVGYSIAEFDTFARHGVGFLGGAGQRIAFCVSCSVFLSAAHARAPDHLPLHSRCAARLPSLLLLATMRAGRRLHASRCPCSTVGWPAISSATTTTWWPRVSSFMERGGSEGRKAVLCRPRWPSALLY